jgi:hypothetical protein
MRVAPGEIYFYPVSLIFGGSIELAPGLSICLVPLGRSLTHSLFTYDHLPTRTACMFSNPLGHLQFFAGTSQLKMTTMEARRSYTPPFSLALDDDDSGRSRRSKSTEDRMNGQREAPAHSSVYTVRRLSLQRHAAHADDVFEVPWSMSRFRMSTRPIVPCHGMRRRLPRGHQREFPSIVLHLCLPRPCQCLTMHHRQPQRVLLALQGQRNRRDIEDAAANDYDRDLPLRHP